jgi:hypothetical protein
MLANRYKVRSTRLINGYFAAGYSLRSRFIGLCFYLEDSVREKCSGVKNAVSIFRQNI